MGYKIDQEDIIKMGVIQAVRVNSNIRENEFISFYGLTKSLLDSLAQTDVPDVLPINNLIEQEFILCLPEEYTLLDKIEVGRISCTSIIVKVDGDYLEGYALVKNNKSNNAFPVAFQKRIENNEVSTKINILKSHWTKPITNIVINFLWYMANYHNSTPKNKRSNLVIPNSYQGKNSYSKTIKIIGKDYKIKTEGFSRPQKAHASPSTHWRRGHWRNQAIGKERKENKLIWIEPVLVNGKED